ncbi:MAG: hypothetical protein KG003_01225 [Bacteroidetes bacterium]|nr:hypothetical protein [Bacteroidota bacterium]
MRNKNTAIYIMVCAIGLIVFQSCKPKKSNESELITTIKITITDGGIPVGEFYWKDPDGDGGNPPTQTDTIKLNSGKTYISKLEFINESNGGYTDITPQIKSESVDHIICYTPTSAILQITPTDSDGKFPIGLQTEWKTNSAGNGSVRVNLRHQPGVKNGTCDPGESDADVSFPFVLQ